MASQDNQDPLITKVSRERWQEAQAAEWELWRKHAHFSLITRGKHFLRNLLHGNFHQLSMWDDWNLWWQAKFQNYSFLPKQLNTVIEVGCGPYANMRLILKQVKCLKVYLSDPLIKEYIKHTKGFVSEAVKQGEALIDNSPAEDLPYKDNYFDLVVMINVLDHVMDAPQALETCCRITKKGGYFILGQELTNEEDVNRHPHLVDIYHPIRVDHTFLDTILNPSFAPVYFKILPREEGRNPEYHYGTYIYAGQKQ